MEQSIRLHNDSGHDQFAESLRENVPLAPMTTLGIGGAARFFVDCARVGLPPAAGVGGRGRRGGAPRFFADCASVEALAAGVAWARANALPVFVLGGGS